MIRALQGVRGVGSIERIGSVEREIRVGLDPVRLQGVGLTALDVSRQLRASNADLAGGRAEIGACDQAIRTLAGAKTLADLAATRIALPTGGEVQLDDLGLITDTRIYPRRDLAVRLGVSTESLSETIRVSTIGDVGPALAKFDAGDRVVPIRVPLEEKARADRQVIEQIRVPSARGAGVPLTALADISFGEGPISIDRFDRQRQASADSHRQRRTERCIGRRQSASGDERPSTRYQRLRVGRRRVPG